MSALHKSRVHHLDYTRRWVLADKQMPVNSIFVDRCSSLSLRNRFRFRGWEPPELGPNAVSHLKRRPGLDDSLDWRDEFFGNVRSNNWPFCGYRTGYVAMVEKRTYLDAVQIPSPRLEIKSARRVDSRRAVSRWV